MTPVEFVQQCPPFDALGQTELEQVAQSLEIVHYPPHRQILSTADPPSNYLYLIRRGAVRLEREGQTAILLEEGELFGFVSLLSQNSPAFDAITDEETELYCLPAATFLQLVQQAAFSQFFLKGLGERLHRVVGLDSSPLTGNMASPVELLITHPPVFVDAQATATQAAQIMRQEQVSSVLVGGNPPGLVTDRDLRNRVLAKGLGPDTPVSQVMSQPLKTLPHDTPVYSALLFMLEEKIHHLPLTRQGEIAGVVTDTDLLRHHTKNPFYLFKRVEKLGDAAALPRYSMEITAIVETLFRSGLDEIHIGRIVSSLNTALTTRLLRLAEQELGPPPCPYAWIVFGSEGRQEQLLLTDQDNALIYQDDTPEARQYFSQLAEQVVNGLLQAGFPPCPGGYMATNWLRPLKQWEHLFKSWVETPEPQALLEASIFFDFRAVYGTLNIDGLDKILLNASKNNLFLAHMARNALGFQPPLGFFRRIREEEGGVDLKKGGLMPIVNLARLYALATGTPARATLARLEATKHHSDLGKDKTEILIEAFHFFLHLRLREQLRSYQTGQLPGNRVPLDSLLPLERLNLKEVFLAIREIQNLIGQAFQTGRLG